MHNIVVLLFTFTMQLRSRCAVSLYFIWNTTISNINCTEWFVYNLITNVTINVILNGHHYRHTNHQRLNAIAFVKTCFYHNVYQLDYVFLNQVLFCCLLLIYKTCKIMIRVFTGSNKYTKNKWYRWNYMKCLFQSFWAKTVKK